MSNQKVVWREGMLLRPQHFQHSDRYYNHQLAVRTQLLSSNTWGFISLQIDPQYLNMGKIVVNEAKGILPDGSFFDIRQELEPLTLDIPTNTNNKPVYLALPLTTDNHIETREASQTDVLARYVMREVEVVDSNTADSNIITINCCQPDFRLILGDEENNSAFVCLKICHILDCSSDKTIVLDSEYVPTYLNLHASSVLLSSLKEVISMLVHRGDRLAERIRASGKTQSAEVGDLLMLQLINRVEPLLRHYLRADKAHPEDVYKELLYLYGELATYASESKRPSVDYYYMHSDQGLCYRKLMERLRQVLSMVLEQHAIELLLQQRAYGIQVSPLHDHTMLSNSKFILAASASCDPEYLRKNLPAYLKCGPVERIRQLVNLHLPGVKVKSLPVAPRQIPFHSGKIYFALELSSDDLAQFESSGGFAFHVSGSFDNLELKFWAIRN